MKALRLSPEARAALREDAEPALELEQARTHAAQLIIAAIEKQGEYSVPDLITWLNAIGEGQALHAGLRSCMLVDAKLSTLWEN